MAPLGRLAALHGMCLLLSAPLFIAYASSNLGIGSGPGTWLVVATGIFYLLIVVSERPKLTYDWLLNFGLDNRLVKFALTAVLLICLSVPLLDADSDAFAVAGLSFLGLSALVFMAGVWHALSTDPAHK